MKILYWICDMKNVKNAPKEHFYVSITWQIIFCTESIFFIKITIVLHPNREYITIIIKYIIIFVCSHRVTLVWNYNELGHNNNIMLSIIIIIKIYSIIVVSVSKFYVFLRRKLTHSKKKRTDDKEILPFFLFGLDFSLKMFNQNNFMNIIKVVTWC